MSHETHDVPPDEGAQLLQLMRGLAQDNGDDPAETVKRIHQRLKQPDTVPLPITIEPLRRRSNRWWWGGLAAACAAGVAFLVAHHTSVLTDTQAKVPEYVSQAGHREMVTLSDGTQIVLGPESRVRVMAGFGRSERAVLLDGQALFTVVHDARRPFVVHTSRADVRDVGTVFAVTDFADEPEESIAVAEGKVAVKDTELGARDLAMVDAGGHFEVRRNADVTPYLAWAQGRLVFQDTPLRDVVRELDRVFDLKIMVADSLLAARHVTATFDNESADQVLDAVTDVLGARYERSGRAVVIRSGAASTRQSVPPSRMPLSTAQAGSAS